MRKKSTSVNQMAGVFSAILMSIVLSSAAVNAADPRVISASPADGVLGVSINTQVVVVFSENMNAATINASTFELRSNGNTVIPAMISYNATLRQATLTPLAALANSTSYKATVVGGNNGVKDASGNKMKGNYQWSFTTIAGADVIPPTVKSVEPGNGATGISLNTQVTAKFSEDMDPSTINTASFELRNSANQIIPASVSYHIPSKKATLIPSVRLANSVVYTAKIKGGSSGVKDLAGNALVADYSWTFSTPFTIFQSTSIPVIPVTSGDPVEVGVKFKTTQSGKIFGIRFYKGIGNDGKHTGHLWNSAGTLIAEAAFTNETASGWQEVLFSSPVAITAGQIYTASYFSSLGKYGYTNSYFTTTVVSGPIRALADGESGGNGVYAYSPLSVFPTSTYSATNYFVDVVFAANSNNNRIYVENNNVVPSVTDLTSMKNLGKGNEQSTKGISEKGKPLTSTLDVRLMGNPSADHFNMVINSNDAKNVTIRVSDISGRVIEVKITSTGVLQLGQTWKSGVYFAEVIQGDQRRVIKMVKTK